MEPLGLGDPAEVGAYRMLAGLGDGNMGRVLLGYAVDGRLVAVKRMHARVVMVDGFRERFRREVAACREVSGHYTASFIDGDADAEIPWFAATYEPGPSLKDAVEATGPLPEDAVLRLAAGLASALVDIHRAGLVHRDLKPANVLLTRQGPKVIDFGVVRANDAPGGTNLTHTGMFVGTPAYMSPEQAGGEPITSVSDVFSLGTVLAMACTGVGPFDGKSFPQTVHDVVFAEPALDGVPPRVRAVIERCWVKDPAERPGPERILAEIGPIPPSTYPWPGPVRQLISNQDGDLRRLLDGVRAGASPTLMDNGRTLHIPVRGVDTTGLPPTRPVKAYSGTAFLVAVVLIGLIVWIIAVNAVDRSGENPSSGGKTPGHTSTHTPSPKSTRTTPTTKPFDPTSLDDEDTDKTSMTASALLPMSFSDDGTTYSRASGNMKGCDDAADGGSKVAGILDDKDCRDLAVGTYLDESDDILVTLLVLALPDSDRADSAYDRVRDDGDLGQWTWWCPKEPASADRVCHSDSSDAAKEGRIYHEHRYIMVARSIYTDLRDSGDSELGSVASAAVNAVNLRP